MELLNCMVFAICLVAVTSQFKQFGGSVVLTGTRSSCMGAPL